MGKDKRAIVKHLWWNKSWNPITGCSHAGSPGCDHCYARRMAKRLAGRYGYPESPHEFDVTLHPDRLDQPLRWKRPRVIFVCSMADLFHEAVPFSFIGKVFAFIIPADWHTFLILTKRPERMQEFVSWFEAKTRLIIRSFRHIQWGVTVETQDQVWRLEELVKIWVPRYWASLEPLLGSIEIPPELLARLSGLVVGGESGVGARPMYPGWARSIRDQCIMAGVAFTFKQWGEWASAESCDWELPRPTTPWVGIKANGSEPSGPELLWGTDVATMVRVGKKAAGRELDGQIWDEFPWQLLDSPRRLIDA